MSKVKWYSERHIWVLLENDMAMIGLSTYAQKQLGAIAFINLPDIGEIFHEGEVLGDVESIKTVSDLISPLDGEVIEVNEQMVDNPESMNDDTETSWLVKLRFCKAPDSLMDEAAYQEYVAQL